jgi:CheY-like chemotaxis protein
MSEQHKGTILVVEDDADMSQNLVECLAEEGYGVRGAASGAEAIGIASSWPFELLITDVRMAHMDGLELVERIRELRPQARSIVITGYASEDAPLKAVRLQVCDYLYKPFGLKDLLRATERALRPEVEKRRLSDILGRFIDKFRVENDLNELENLREHGFRAFYVAVRSNALAPSNAHVIWNQLELLDSERRGLRDDNTQQRREQVIHAYQYLIDLMGGLSASARQFELSSARSPTFGTVSRADFDRFYENLRVGMLSPEELSLAPFLRTVEPQALADNRDLEGLRAVVWGTPARA